MLTFRSILAIIAICGFILRPNGRLGAASIAAGCLVELGIGAPLAPAVRAVLPLVVFIGAALTLASLLERAGLAERAAVALARTGRGHLLALFALICGACAVLTTVVSLDEAVVLMVPLLLVLCRRCSVPFAPFFTGVVVVANVASLALPQGQHTNLVVMARLGLSAREFTAHMFLPGIAAAVIAALLVAISERRALAGGHPAVDPTAARWRAAIARSTNRSVHCRGGSGRLRWRSPLPPALRGSRRWSASSHGFRSRLSSRSRRWRRVSLLGRRWRCALARKSARSSS